MKQGKTKGLVVEGVTMDDKTKRGVTGRVEVGGLTVAMLRDCLGETGTEIRVSPKWPSPDEWTEVLDRLLVESLEAEAGGRRHERTG